MVTNPFQLQLIAPASSEAQPDTPDVITPVGPCQDTSLSLTPGAGEHDRRVVLRHARRRGCGTAVAAEREQAARGHPGQRRGRRLGEPRVAEGRTDGREPDRERAPPADPSRLAGAREPTSHPRCGQQLSVTPVRIALKQTRREDPRRSDPACRRHRRTAHRGRAGGVARHARRNRVVARIRGAPNLTEEALAEMVGALARLGRAVEAGDPREYLGVSWAMRVPCYAAAGRPRLFRRATDLFQRSRRYHLLNLSEQDRLEWSRTCSSASPRPATSATVPSPERSRTRASNGLSTTSSRRCSSPPRASAGGTRGATSPPERRGAPCRG